MVCFCNFLKIAIQFIHLVLKVGKSVENALELTPSVEHLRAFVDDDMVWLLSRGLFPVAAALSVFGKMRKGGFAEVIRWGSFISCCVVAHYPYCVAQYSNTS